MTHLKFRNFLSAAILAVGLTAIGGATAGAVMVPSVEGASQAANVNQAATVDQPQTATDQTGESVNNNKDDGQVGQTGDQQTGESVNGNHDDGQVGQAG
jgi:hypothetical protein